VGTSVSPTNKTDSYDITKTSLKVALNTIALTLFWIEASKIAAKVPLMRTMDTHA